MLRKGENLMSPPTSIATAEELFRLPDAGMGYELVNGHIVERPASTETHYIAGQLMAALMTYSEKLQPLWVTTQYPFRCSPGSSGQVRRPSVAALAWERITLPRDDDYFPCPIVPDVVAEVVAARQAANDVETRLAEWLAAGVKVVWVLHPMTRTIRVHGEVGFTANGAGFMFLRPTDKLMAPSVLPGFSVPVAELFRLPG